MNEEPRSLLLSAMAALRKNKDVCLSFDLEMSRELPEFQTQFEVEIILNHYYWLAEQLSMTCLTF